MSGLSKLLVIFCSLFLISIPASAINFDKLTDQQQVDVVGASTTGSSALSFPPANVLGGTRYVEVQKTFGTSVSSLVTSGFLDHSQNASTRGSSLFVWDGNPLPGIQYTGLGGLNLLADGATGIRVVIEGFDFPNNQNLFIIFTLFDASDPTGFSKSSRAVVTLSSGINSTTTIDLPFSSFQPLVSQLASLNNIGAIAMLIDGTATPAHDLTLSFVGTDGRCTHVPVNNLVVDQCNVCNGNNSTCADCEGTPNGTKLPGTSCTTGNVGVCADGTYTGTAPNCNCTQNTPPTTEKCDNLDNNCNGSVDDGIGKGDTCTVGVGSCSKTGTKVCGTNGTVVCSVTPGTPQTEICDGIDNDCNGLIDDHNPGAGPLTDQCGVCGGNNSTCLDCKGVPNGTSTIDQCGICGGNGTSCLDCKGTPNGTAKVDQCGICGGDGKSCVDCKGTLRGTAKVDQCGVCGGDNTSCTDCKGVVNGTSTLDACGVCGGNGTSCCSTSDQSDILASLDSGAKEQEQIVRKASALLKKLTPGKALESSLKTVAKEAHALQIRNWILSWTIPVFATSCQHEVSCATHNNISTLAEYRLNNDRLRELAKGVLSKISAALKKKKNAQASKQLMSYLAWADRVHANNLKLSFMVPETQLMCS